VNLAIVPLAQRPNCTSLHCDNRIIRLKGEAMAPTGTFLITGANGGLGTQVVSRLISNPSLASSLYGLYTVRNPSTATSFKQVLSRAPAVHKHSIEALDLGKLKDVRTLADSINSRVASSAIPPIRALVLCAGYQEGEEQDFSEDGFAMSFQANYLSHWLLTLLLLKSMDPKEGRIVVLGSWTHE
jgi:NAD(P)-dependent dehydrogenase (short-subunit alcohol dehydrogenase family)